METVELLNSHTTQWRIKVDWNEAGLAADDDLTFPLDVARGLAASAGVTLELLPGDHCLMLSAPSVVVGALAGGSPREVG